MKKLLLSLVVASLFTPALSMAESATAPVTHEKHAPDFQPANSPASDMTSPTTAPAAEPAKKMDAKVCNPKKSKQCGKACIPLKRVCKKK